MDAQSNGKDHSDYTSARVNSAHVMSSWYVCTVNSFANCYDKTQRRMILASATLKEGGGRAYSNRSRLNQLKAKVHEAGNGSLIYKREMVRESAQSRVLNETCRRTMPQRCVNDVVP